MSNQPRRRRSAGRDAKRAARQKMQTASSAFIERKIPYFELLSDEGLQLIEDNAETVLEEILARHPNFSPARYNLACIAMGKEEAQRALELLSR